VKGQDLSLFCRKERKYKSCEFYENEMTKSSLEYNIPDIEDFNDFALENKFCPYFQQRNKMENSQLILLTYNYIFYDKIRTQTEINLSNSIILIDEAHNIDKVCQEASSLTLTNNLIEMCLIDFFNFLKYSTKYPYYESIKLDKFTYYIKSDNERIRAHIKYLQDVQSQLTLYEIYKNENEEYKQKLTMEDLFKIFCLKENDFDDNFKMFDDSLLIKSVQHHIEEEENKPSMLSQFLEIKQKVNFLFRINKESKEILNNFRLFIEGEVIKKNLKEPNTYNTKKLSVLQNKTLHIYCVNPAYAFHQVIMRKPKTVILTSGTLKPFDFLESELNYKFECEAISSGIFNELQMDVLVLTNSTRSNKKFHFTHKCVDEEMITELGYSLLDIIKLTPEGILIFFSSYSQLNFAEKVFEKNQILAQIKQHKEVFFEKDKKGENIQEF
jgi:regulator of telomere elongation helicase 1